MAKCDLCGESCKASEMVELLDSYQIPGCVEICPGCGRWANKVKSEALGQVAKTVRSAIAARKGGPEASKVAVIWARVRRVVALGFGA